MLCTDSWTWDEDIVCGHLCSAPKLRFTFDLSLPLCVCALACVCVSVSEEHMNPPPHVCVLMWLVKFQDDLCVRGVGDGSGGGDSWGVCTARAF